MFDDSKIPSNLPIDKEPEDIFKDVGPAQFSPSDVVGTSKSAIDNSFAEHGAVQPPISSTAPNAVPAQEVEIKSPLIASKKIIIILGVIIGILVIVGVVVSAIRFVNRSAQDTSVKSSLLTEEASVTEDIPALPEVSFSDSQELEGEGSAVSETQLPVDSDGDGLTDKEELEIGTDFQNPDSDNDGLFDGEEIQTYKTDPLNSDTDQDSFLDGGEVSNNYNPRGEGRLFEIPSQ